MLSSAELFHFVHLGDAAMAGLALYFAGADMLGVIEINVVRQVVDLDPFDLFAGLGIFAGFRIVAGIASTVSGFRPLPSTSFPFSR